MDKIIKINRNLIWYFWATWVFGIVLEIIFQAPSGFIWTLFIGGFIAFGMVHLLILSDRFPYVVPYLLMTVSYMLCTLMIFQNLHITTLVEFFYGLAMSALYQNRRVVILSYFYSVGLSVYFFMAYPEHFVGYELRHYATFIAILTIVAGCLVIQSIISKLQFKTIEEHNGQLKEEFERNKLLADNMAANTNAVFQFSNFLNDKIIQLKKQIDDSHQDFSHIRTGSNEQLNYFYQMKESIDKNSQGIEMSKNLAIHLDESFKKGLEEMANLSKQSEELYQFMDEYIVLNHELVQLVNEMNASQDDIRKITSVIMTITEQTKYLSLNASIEAARGSQGSKGFTVVSEEIKKLSDSNQASLVDIEKIIETSLTKMQIIKEKEKNAFDQVAMNIDKIKNIMNTMEKLIQNTNENRENVEKMSRSFASVFDNQTIINQQLELSNETVNKNISLIEKTSTKLIDETRTIDDIMIDSEQLVQKQKYYIIENQK